MNARYSVFIICYKSSVSKKSIILSISPNMTCEFWDQSFFSFWLCGKQPHFEKKKRKIQNSSKQTCIKKVFSGAKYASNKYIFFQKQCQGENSICKRIGEAHDTILILEIFIQKTHSIVYSFYFCKSETCIFAFRSIKEKTNPRRAILQLPRKNISACWDKM